jgi:hypothetical protein
VSGVLGSGTPETARSVDKSTAAPESEGTGNRPCRYCLAAYPLLEAADCKYSHRDDPRVYELAKALARVCQQKNPTDEQVCWFLADANEVVDDFDPTPDKWQVRKLPDDFSEFDARFRINDVTYVLPPGDKCETHPVRLSTYRSWQRET